MSGLRDSGLITNNPGIEADVIAASVMAVDKIRYATVQKTKGGGQKVTAYIGR